MPSLHPNFSRKNHFEAKLRRYQRFEYRCRDRIWQESPHHFRKTKLGSFFDAMAKSCGKQQGNSSSKTISVDYRDNYFWMILIISPTT